MPPPCCSHLGAQKGVLLANRICPQQAQTKTHAQLSAGLFFVLECSPSIRKKNKVRMKGGRRLAEVTARLKPLQSPGLSHTTHCSGNWPSPGLQIQVPGLLSSSLEGQSHSQVSFPLHQRGTFPCAALPLQPGYKWSRNCCFAAAACPEIRGKTNQQLLWAWTGRAGKDCMRGARS